ncbi:MAG: ferrochelatase [Acidobacteria bacterium]|nr:ferrochelatase [Acidobacteriota bacterium]
MPRPVALVVNLGTPAAPSAEAVREFLAEFLGDRNVVDAPRWFWRPVLHGIVLRSRPRRVAEQYRAIWSAEGSPLAAGTMRIVRALAARCPEYDVRPAYRYGAPSLAGEIARAAREPGQAAWLVPLFPQRTCSTTGTIRELAAAAACRGGAAERVRLAEVRPDAPGYVEALAARCRETFAAGGTPQHLVLSFHGIPVRYDRREGGVYVADCRATADALCARLDWEPARATLSFQSRFGPERWLAPPTADVLAGLPARGVRDVAVVAPGFVTDGLETIEELGIRGREQFLAAGGERFARVPAVEDHPAFVEAIAAALREAAG